MAPGLKAPAAGWRTLCALACLVLGVSPQVHAQRAIAPPTGVGQIGAPSQAEAREILQRFRTLGIDGDYYLEFQLRVMPRRGPETIHTGRMWGAHAPSGDITRVQLGSGADEQRLLVLSGPRPAAWQLRRPGGAVSVGEAGLFEPLLRTDLTAFDLLRPFIHWPDATFVKLARASGRTTHEYLLVPPPDFAAKAPALGSVRIYLDTVSNALVQTEELDRTGRLAKSMTVLALKRIGERWIVRTIDVRNERTGDKTRFTVTAAALGLDLGETIFLPAELGSDLRPPAGVVLVP